MDRRLICDQEGNVRAMLGFLIDRTTSIPLLRDSIVSIADELRAINGRVLVVRIVAEDESVDLALASGLLELMQLLPVELIEVALDCGIVAACNKALARAREAKAGVFLLRQGSQLAAGSLSEMFDVAGTDPMIGVVGAPMSSETIANTSFSYSAVTGRAQQTRVAFEHVHAYLPRVSYVATASGPCFYIGPALLAEFGGLDESYATLSAAQDEFIMRCNLRGFQAVLANRAFVHCLRDVYEESTPRGLLERDYQNLEQAYPHLRRAMQRTLDSAEFNARRLLMGIVPDDRGRRRILFESSHLGCFFNGTFLVATKIVAHFVEQFSSRFECWISCSPEALQFHGLDTVDGLHYAGDLAQAARKGPYLAAIRLAQPFSLQDLVHLGSIAPLSGFLMLDTIAMDCQNLDERDLRTVWNRMMHTVSMVGYISQYTADQFNRRFMVSDTVTQATILLSTEPADYVQETREPKRADYLLVVGNQYSHKHLHETIAVFRRHPKRPALVVLGSKIHDEPGIASYPSGGLDNAFVEKLYGNALAIVFPSFYEGFGLPLMHALGYKKPVFARTIPVFDEIRRRAPGGRNVHLFASTEEIVDAALVGAPWIEHSAKGIDMQTWVDAARQIESLIRTAEGKLSFAGLHSRLLEVRACEAMIPRQDAVPSVVQAEVSAAPAELDPTRIRQTPTEKAIWPVAESYIVRGARAWLLFEPGSRPHRTAQRTIRSMARFVSSRPKLASAVKALVARRPGLADRLRNAIQIPLAEQGAPPMPDDLSYLSTEAQGIAQHLRCLMGKH